MLVVVCVNSVVVYTLIVFVVGLFDYAGFGLFARCLYCLNAAGSGWVVLPWVIGL